MELLDKLNFLVNKYKNLSPRAQKVVRLAAKKTALLHGVRRAKRIGSNLVKAAKAKKIADAAYLPSLGEFAGFRLGPFNGIYESTTNAYHKYKNNPDAYDNVYDLYADAITDYINFRNNTRSIAQRARRTNLSNSNNRNTATNLNINSNRRNSAVVNRRKANGSFNNYIPPTATSSIPGNYTILNGDTLSSIAANNGMTVLQIMALNPLIKNANKIYAGHTLNLNSLPILDDVLMALASSKIENTKPIEDNHVINNLITTKVTPEINTLPVEINPRDQYRRFEQYVDSMPNYNFDLYRTLDMNKLLEGLKQYI